MIKKRKNTIELVNETINEFGEVMVSCKLQDKLDELGMTVMELMHLTGIRYASLNDLKNNKKVTLNLQHLLAIMVALRIKSFDELFELKFEEEENEKEFEEEVEYYYSKGLPDSALDKMKKNKAILDEHYKSTGN